MLYLLLQRKKIFMIKEKKIPKTVGLSEMFMRPTPLPPKVHSSLLLFLLVHTSLSCAFVVDRLHRVRNVAS